MEVERVKRVMNRKLEIQHMLDTFWDQKAAMEFDAGYAMPILDAKTWSEVRPFNFEKLNRKLEIQQLLQLKEFKRVSKSLKELKE